MQNKKIKMLIYDCRHYFDTVLALLIHDIPLRNIGEPLINLYPSLHILLIGQQYLVLKNP